MDSSRLAPETPRRQLLKRIHRRSSILPSMDPSSHLAASSSASSTSATARSSSRRTSLNPDNASPLLGNNALEKHDEEDEDYQHPDYDRSAIHTEQTQASSYTPASIEHHDGAHFENDEADFQGDENGEEAAWAQVDELMDTLQLRNQRILELEKTVSQLQRDSQLGKERNKSSKGKSAPGNADDKGLTRAAAVKLEREFLSQEMILKGLQRDNEDKTLEVEALRRKVKIMSDFLARQYGPDDWEAVVFASSGGVATSTAKESLSIASPEKESLSAVARVLGAANAGSPRAANRAKFTPVLGSDAYANPFSPSASSPSKALGAINNDDVLIPTIARLHTPSSSPSKQFVPSFSSALRADDDLGDADTSVEQGAAALARDQHSKSSPAATAEGTRSTLPDGVDPNVLLASIESVRLLLQGFERKNAMRRAELEATIDKAIEAERRAERLQSHAAAASTLTPEAVSVAAS
ncbi:hypothetical protein EX895_001689 [Sporisorium graminicola]|uniref:Uncharacterized protein n=1 Tax=Sporisorium graminicola TaxID=280036 RepID=A0A4U7L091_9BASI|nr:hypothetical protein EX895_001689 [Sporisorium graminicola]TKY89158.1 hypothetical protein EX895_001689 [Sporisorium graminicola]